MICVSHANFKTYNEHGSLVCENDDVRDASVLAVAQAFGELLTQVCISPGDSAALLEHCRNAGRREDVQSECAAVFYDLRV